MVNKSGQSTTTKMRLGSDSGAVLFRQSVIGPQLRTYAKKSKGTIHARVFSPHNFLFGLSVIAIPRFEPTAFYRKTRRVVGSHPGRKLRFSTQVRASPKNLARGLSLMPSFHRDLSVWHGSSVRRQAERHDPTGQRYDDDASERPANGGYRPGPITRSSRSSLMRSI